MDILSSRLYRWMDVLANFFLLNILWLLVCIPLITIFPATAALFAVVRDWVRGKDTGFFMPFFRYMRQNFAQSLTVGITWTIVGAVLVVDFFFVRQMTSWVRMPLLVLLIVTVVVYLGTAVNLFPVMAHVHAGWLHIIRNSFLIAIGSPIMTVLKVLVVALAGLAIYYIPLTFLVFGSVTAYLIYHLFHIEFQQIEAEFDGKEEE